MRAHCVKICTSCGEEKPLNEFHHYGRGVRTGKWCQKCWQRLIGCRVTRRRQYAAIRREMLKRAQPPWADRKRIAEIYAIAAWLSRITGRVHHVDHVDPLVSAKVCGLHCEHNLTIRTARSNLQKGNRFP